MATEKMRAWWALRQGLDGRPVGATAADVLAETGWARSVGGCTPYLGLFARAGIGRAQVDADVAALEVHELPSARGCAYVLPKADFALGLTVGAGAPEGDVAAAERRLGVTRAEIDRLADRVLGVLDETGEPMDPADIRSAAGDAVRSLGDAGRRSGQSTTLPMVLGLLQARGDIRRVPVNGRLDQQRFAYTRWGFPGPALDPDEARVELARRYFRWAGPASVKHFRWFSGFSAAHAKAAVAPLGLTPADGTDLLLPPELAGEYADFTVPAEPQFALVAGIDGIHLLHREMTRLYEPADLARPQPGAKAGRTIGDDPDPQCPILVDRGRIVGLWEYDVDAQEIVYDCFTGDSAELRAAVAATERYVRDELGDARMSVLDSPRSREPRVQALRAGR